MCTYKNLEEMLKTWKHFEKNEWQPCINFIYARILVINIVILTLKLKHLQNGFKLR